MDQRRTIGLMLDYSYAYFRRIAIGVRSFGDTRPGWLFVPTTLERGQMLAYDAAPLDGLLVNVGTSVRADAVKKLKIPVVNAGGKMPDLPIPTVRVDNVAVGRMAAEHLLEFGLSNFAYAGHPRFLICSEREAAFCSAIADAGYTVACYHSDPRRQWSSDAQHWYLGKRVHRWLLSLPKPVGLFVPGDFWGVELTHICRQLDLRIPEDIAVVGADDDHLHCEFSRPKLSSVVLPAEQIGYESAALMERLLMGEKPPSEDQLLSPFYVHARRSSEALAIDDEDVVAAARFIREQAYLPITVADVLREIPISRRSLERRFQQALGRGLLEEINRVRLQRCKQLLAETSFDMASIARQCGFSSARHMAAAFRREMNMSLTGYRRQARVNAFSRLPEKLG